MSAQNVFDTAYELVKYELPFDRNWSNGAGQFDYAVYGEHAPELHQGEVAKAVTPGNRRIILIGTLMGNVVISERYKEKNKDGFIVNANAAFAEGRWVFSNEHISKEIMETLLGEAGYIDRNIGWRIKQLYDTLRQFDKRSKEKK